MLNRGIARPLCVSLTILTLGISWQESVQARDSASSRGAAILQALDAKTPVADTNGDGKPDLWRDFSPDGRMTKFRSDTNGNGKPDLTVRLEPGRQITLEDTDGDGRPDWRTIDTFEKAGRTVQSRVTEQRAGNAWRLVESKTLQRAEGKRKKDLYKIRQIRSDGTEEVTYEGVEVH